MSAVVVSIVMLKDLLHFAEIRKERLHSSLSGKTFCLIPVDNVSSLIVHILTTSRLDRCHPSLSSCNNSSVILTVSSFHLVSHKKFLLLVFLDFSNILEYMWCKGREGITFYNALFPHRFFFLLEGGWTRTWGTCNILMHSLMRFWQPLVCYSDKGGKRTYIEEISQGFWRKRAKWQSKWLKKIQGAQRGL